MARSAAGDSLDAAGITADVLGATASRLFDAAPAFVPASRAGEHERRFLAQMRVEEAEVRGSGAGGGPAAFVAVALVLEPGSGERSLRELGRGSVPIGDGPTSLRSALERAANAAVANAIRSLSMQLAAEHKAKAELVRDLASRDPSVRDHAMRVLADRGERDAVPALTAQLHDPDPDVRERAVGALAQLRDPRSVPALIDLVRHRDPHYVAHMALIIGDIGGPDARGWLLTMAFGHPEQVVRTAAHEALADMNARALHASVDQGRQ